MKLYYAHLVLNREHPCVSRDMANPYEMHRTILSAYPANLGLFAERVLWRLSVQDEAWVLTVQSHEEPDFLRLPTGYTLAFVCGWQEYVFSPGQRWHFVLHANPTKRQRGDQIAWLERKGETHGFAVAEAHVQGGGLVIDARGLTWQATRFVGHLTVINADLLAKAVATGIGSAKDFGFGLLTLTEG